MIDLDVGGGQTATVNEPERGAFTSNLGGAVQFILAHAFYSALEFAGDALGSFLAGVAVRFLDRIEPGLVDYAAPMLDMLLENPELPIELRELFTNLKTPLHESGAALLTGFSQQATGAAVGGLLNVLLAPAVYWANEKMRLTLPGISEMAAMLRRDLIDKDAYDRGMGYLGFSQELADAFIEITRPRAGVADIVDGLYRGNLSEVEPVGDWRVNLATVTDFGPWRHELPTVQK